MRFTRPIYHFGDVCVKTEFLFIPRTLPSFEGSEVKITRWLERASWTEVARPTPGHGGIWWDALHWNDFSDGKREHPSGVHE